MVYLFRYTMPSLTSHAQKVQSIVQRTITAEARTASFHPTREDSDRPPGATCPFRSRARAGRPASYSRQEPIQSPELRRQTTADARRADELRRDVALRGCGAVHRLPQAP